MTGLGKLAIGGGVVTTAAVGSYAAANFIGKQEEEIEIKMWFEKDGCHFEANTVGNNYCLKFLQDELDEATLKKIKWEKGKGIDSENTEGYKDYDKYKAKWEEYNKKFNRN